MFVFGAWYSSWAIKSFGYLNTLWSSIFWVCLGAFFALILNRDRFEKKKADKREKAQELMKESPSLLKIRVCSLGIIRIINSIGTYGFPVFLPMHMAQHGISTNVWLQIWGTIFLGNIVFNLIFGAVGDAFGWKKTVMWFGEWVAAFLLFYYIMLLLYHMGTCFSSALSVLYGEGSSPGSFRSGLSCRRRPAAIKVLRHVCVKSGRGPVGICRSRACLGVHRTCRRTRRCMDFRDALFRKCNLDQSNQNT